MVEHEPEQSRDRWEDELSKGDLAMAETTFALTSTTFPLRTFRTNRLPDAPQTSAVVAEITAPRSSRFNPGAVSASPGTMLDECGASNEVIHEVTPGLSGTNHAPCLDLADGIMLTGANRNDAFAITVTGG
jgi:hypothetical protein